MPFAETLKLAEAPAVRVAPCGWLTMVGAAWSALTVKVAAELVAEPALFVTVTV